MIKVKVCGINNSENLKSLLTLPVDMVGFIFDDTSERNCTLSSEIVKEAFSKQNLTCKKVGIFVDAPLAEVLKKQEEYELDYVQLNGKENIFYCQLLREHQLKLIKSFSVCNDFCYSNTSAYSFFCDYFVFECQNTFGPKKESQFNLNSLKNYKGKKPFFLSSEWGMNQIESIRQMDFEYLNFINIIESFEIKPGHKNLDVVADFIYKIKRPESFNTRDNLDHRVSYGS